MSLSLITFAIIDAAAIDTLSWSPLTIGTDANPDFIVFTSSASVIAISGFIFNLHNASFITILLALPSETLSITSEGIFTTDQHIQDLIIFLNILTNT